MSRNRNVVSIIILLAALVAWSAQAQEPTTEGEFGDAPEGAIAYPSTGVIGAFPTCIAVTPATYIMHTPAASLFFGPMKDYEFDGNGGLCPIFAPYDQDECFVDPDAGLLFPGAFTIVGGGVVTCAGAAGPLGTYCGTGTWGVNLDIQVTNLGVEDAYVNVLMDWNQDGRWAPSTQNFCSAPEHVLVDFPVPAGYVGPLSGLMPPAFVIGGDPGYVWSRFTISELPVGTPWGGDGLFADGETEDYLLLVDGPVANEDESWGALKQMYR